MIRRSGAGRWWRVLVSAALLGWLAWMVDLADLGQSFAQADPLWLAIALALSVPQVMLSALRWQLTAHQLGIPLRYVHALREYYLATFLNQIMPGGVLGDASRAYRHASTLERARPAWHAVLIERVSGQVALVLFALIGVWTSPPLQAAFGRLFTASSIWVAALGCGAILLGITVVRSSTPHRVQWLRLLMQDVHRALLSSRSWLLQLVGSMLVVGSYVLVFLCCARALGVHSPASLLWPLMAWTLVAMAIPASVAGWGLRESAAAITWPLAGLPASEGIAVSICYGLVVLVSSVPGLWVLLRPTGTATRRHA